MMSDRAACITCIACIGALGCSSPDFNGPFTIDLTQLPWALTLNAHAITMDTLAPYDTLQLTAVTRTIDGTALPNTVAPTFTSSDSSVRVSATGLLTARVPRTGVRIIATVLYNGVRASDTAVVNVTASANPPRLQHLQLQLQPGKDSTLGVLQTLESLYHGLDTKTVLVGAQDGTGARIPGALVTLRISDQLQGYFLTGLGSGGTTSAASVRVAAHQAARMNVPFTVYASTTVYGVTMEDSLHLLVVEPAVVAYTIKKSVSTNGGASTYVLQPQAEFTIPVGGYVWWSNQTSSVDSLDIVFDDPSAVSPDDVYGPSTADPGGGNIVPFPGGPLTTNNQFQFIRTRRFLQAGQFHWTSTRTGLSGTVVVQ